MGREKRKIATPLVNLSVANSAVDDRKLEAGAGAAAEEAVEQAVQEQVSCLVQGVARVTPSHRSLRIACHPIPSYLSRSIALHSNRSHSILSHPIASIHIDCWHAYDMAARVNSIRYSSRGSRRRRFSGRSRVGGGGGGGAAAASRGSRVPPRPGLVWVAGLLVGWPAGWAIPSPRVVSCFVPSHLVSACLARQLSVLSCPVTSRRRTGAPSASWISARCSLASAGLSGLAAWFQERAK